MVVVAYGIGNSVEVVGVTTAAGHVVGILTVTNVYSAVDQVVQIAGIRSDTNSKLIIHSVSLQRLIQNKCHLHLQRSLTSVDH